MGQPHKTKGGGIVGNHGPPAISAGSATNLAGSIALRNRTLLRRRDVATLGLVRLDTCWVLEEVHLMDRTRAPERHHQPHRRSRCQLQGWQERLMAPPSLVRSKSYSDASADFWALVPRSGNIYHRSFGNTRRRNRALRLASFRIRLSATICV